MPSTSTLAVIAVLAYGCAVMSLPMKNSYSYDLVGRDYEDLDARMYDMDLEEYEARQLSGATPSVTTTEAAATAAPTAAPAPSAAPAPTNVTAATAATAATAVNATSTDIATNFISKKHHKHHGKHHGHHGHSHGNHRGHHRKHQHKGKHAESTDASPSTELASAPTDLPAPEAQATLAARDGRPANGGGRKNRRGGKHGGRGKQGGRHGRKGYEQEADVSAAPVDPSAAAAQDPVAAQDPAAAQDPSDAAAPPPDVAARSRSSTFEKKQAALEQEARHH